MYTFSFLNPNTFPNMLNKEYRLPIHKIIQSIPTCPFGVFGKKFLYVFSTSKAERISYHIYAC